MHLILHTLKTCALTLGLLLMAAVAQAQVAESLLERDLQAGMKSMSREVKVYNYFNVLQTYNELMNPDGRAAFLKRYYDSALDRFWDPNFNQSTYINAGPGLYAAIDPLISKGFGNTMMEMTIPEGTPYINVVNPIRLNQDTIQNLLNEGVLTAQSLPDVILKVSSSYGFTRDTLKNMIKPGYQNFRSMVQRIFVKNSIGIVEYNWDTSLSVFCRKHSYSAFVFTGVRRASSDGRAYYEDNIGKVLVYGVELAKLTPLEIETSVRVNKFKDLLEKMKATSSNSAKSSLIASYYPDENEKLDLMNKTFSCEK